MGASIDASRVLVTWPAKDVALWLEGREVGALVDGEPFNWDGFAFTAAARARKERDLPWANIALHVYEALASHDSADPANTFWFSAMNLRAWMIRELGAQRGDPVLDPEVLVQWVRKCARISFDEASRLASMDLRGVPIETVRELRNIKNSLSVLSNITETPRVRDDSALQEWLKLRDRLP
ncbi:hypothetical protein LZ198_29560 [Myxococcus sp. K15C18031901]|uniref:hypothetical protein n=1 Tax=Myxococcus dinghuensis TaxID=2906761 RepID=UPI0020A7849C|nr:hypothetical protein [Myxococcus dinghuensis]MCP3103034.1 hypothetical protein [Myxococcus dinghuensis]